MSQHEERDARLLASWNENNPGETETIPQHVESVDGSNAFGDSSELTESERQEADVAGKQKSLDDLSDSELRAVGGSRLKHARLSKGMLLRDVVDRMAKVWPNVEHVSRLQSYESGARMMSIQTARHLGRALDVSAAWLLCVDDTIGIDDEQLEILRLYIQAPDAVRKLVSRMLRGTGV